MKKVFFTILLACAFFTFPKLAFADLINPEYYIQTCNPGEILVKCNYVSTEPFGPRTFNGCAKYENNPNYRNLTGEGSSFGGKEKYCFKPTFTGEYIGYSIKSLLSLLAITIVLELIVSFHFFAKSRRVLVALISANVVSVSLLYILTTYIPFTGFIGVVILEAGVIIFEALFMGRWLKEPDFKKMLRYSVVANVISLSVGTLVITLLSSPDSVLEFLSQMISQN